MIRLASRIRRKAAISDSLRALRETYRPYHVIADQAADKIERAMLGAAEYAVSEGTGAAEILRLYRKRRDDALGDVLGDAAAATVARTRQAREFAIRVTPVRSLPWEPPDVKIPEPKRETIQRVIDDTAKLRIPQLEASRIIRDMLVISDQLSARIWRSATADPARMRAALAGNAAARRAIQQQAQRAASQAREAVARRIARTESVRIVTAARRAEWERQQDQGELSRAARQIWIVTADDVTCPECIDMANRTAPIGGAFRGGIDGPPLHPNCRCHIEVRDPRG